MIYFAPLQSYTTLPYYLAFHSQIGGIDKYFTPFYRINKQGIFEFESQLKADYSICLIPQVLTNNSKDLATFAQEMLNRGFKEMNLNIGCPFPMVANRHLGSGLLPYADEIKQMLDEFYNKQIPIKLSIKSRLGWQDPMDIFSVIQVLNDFPIHELILHPRIGIQKYKGEPDWSLFEKVLNIWQGDIIGNGDINTIEDLKEKQSSFNDAKGWMLGRGLLTNPLLLSEEEQSSGFFLKKLQNLHDAFYQNLLEFGYAEGQILNHLKCFWEYPSKNFSNGERIFRKLKKTGKMHDYWDFPKLFFDQALEIIY
ncbi:tRNA-dihydrouridine synthase family protein [Plebeiibacterium sediminum]|uniref:tRNA-dihydrouridine synthase n=1 Tax=Plebeiibacterium sediminum TaxID=2992112 RepID=A0AAE3SDS3_9BACT|nr:tRNA-dihydrouridine synthase family protein [Plebeiobacterium sediminum]MCW3785728.1 tRNA-dihydrouridine synthase family protein [Plebeiobacterium sediminum]